jgi:hypothetical protein
MKRILTNSKTKVNVVPVDNQSRRRPKQVERVVLIAPHRILDFWPSEEACFSPDPR